jgi:hypothetical protein
VTGCVLVAAAGTRVNRAARLPITRDGPLTMSDRILTFDDLHRRGARPGIAQLRRLERSLRRRIASLDARVDELLDPEGPPTDLQVAEVDVLCAAIAEARELLEEARHESARHAQARRARRRRPRRWG